MRRLLRHLARGAAILFLGAGLAEAVIALVLGLSAPPPFAIDYLRRLYEFEMRAIQFEPECARFDPQLLYTLRPGRCTFSNREFSNDYLVNSIGLRDDEASLAAPEVIVLGDSQAMGWGVDQEETYAQLLERRSSLRVLNAGVSSYGTARQIALLERIDLRDLLYLVIHYNSNDYEENRSFFKHGNRWGRKKETDYSKHVRRHQGEARYHLGKYLYSSLEILSADLFRSEKDAARSREHHDEAKYFLNAVLHAGPEGLESRQIIVIETVTEDGDETTPFLSSLRREMASNEGRALIRSLRIVDPSRQLNEEHRHVLDSHLDESGHEVVASLLWRALQDRDRAGPALGTVWGKGTRADLGVSRAGIPVAPRR
jgi:hypothetical protein